MHTDGAPPPPEVHHEEPAQRPPHRRRAPLLLAPLLRHQPRRQDRAVEPARRALEESRLSLSFCP